jgi:hypothetical protein
MGLLSALDASFNEAQKWISFHATSQTVGPNVKNANDCKRGRHTTRGEYLPQEGHVERKRVSISFFTMGSQREFLTHLSA